MSFLSQLLHSLDFRPLDIFPLTFRPSLHTGAQVKATTHLAVADRPSSPDLC